MAELSVVVGVDDSPGAEAALRWALADAAARRAPLRVVHAYRWHYTYDRIPMAGRPAADDLQRTAESADQLVRVLVDRCRESDAEVPVVGAAVAGRPPVVLLAESDSAAVLVLGSRHLKAIGAEVFGSVSAAVAARARCPTVVVRGPGGLPAEQAAVVVGVDGSRAAEPLLRFGFDHARRHRTPLRAVLCWHPDLLATMQWRPEPPPPEQAERWLGESLAGWQADYPDVPVHPEVLREHTVDGLIDASLTARLLVVGNRGRHPGGGTLLGSTSQAVLHHAGCPVAIVPVG